MGDVYDRVILSLGAASLIQSLPGGYIPRVEKERGIRHVIASQWRIVLSLTLYLVYLLLIRD